MKDIKGISSVELLKKLLIYDENTAENIDATVIALKEAEACAVY